MEAQCLVCMVYFSTVFVCLTQTYVLSSYTNTGSSTSITSGQRGQEVIDRSKRSVLSTPRLEKLLDTYANLAQLGKVSPVNKLHRTDSPLDIAQDGIVSVDGGLEYLGEDDTTESREGRGWERKYGKEKSSKEINSEPIGLNPRQPEIDGEDDDREDAGSVFLDEELREKLRSRLLDPLNYFYLLKGDDTANDKGDNDISRLLADVTRNSESSQTLNAKNKRQQGWHFQYGKRSIPEYRRI